MGTCAGGPYRWDRIKSPLTKYVACQWGVQDLQMAHIVVRKAFRATRKHACHSLIRVAGCECLPQWTYTSSKGQKYTINGTCANPGNDWPTDWCAILDIRPESPDLFFLH